MYDCWLVYDSSLSYSKAFNSYCFLEHVLWQNHLHLPPSRSYPSTFLNLKRALLSSVCNVKVHPETMEASQKIRKKNKGNRKGSWIYGVMAISESNAALSVCQGQTWIIKNAQLARLLGMSGFSVVNMAQHEVQLPTRCSSEHQAYCFGRVEWRVPGWSCNGQRLRDENSRLLDLGWPEHGSRLHFSSLYSIQWTSAVVIGSEWHDR